MTTRLIFIAGLLVTGIAIAQGQAPLTRERIDALLQSSYTHIDGKQTPELVPFTSRMQLFFDFFRLGSFGAELKPKLSAGDHAILATFANESPQLLKKDGQDYHNAYLKIAQRARDMNGVEIAAAVQAATDDMSATQTRRYNAVLAQLTPEGRQIVNDFAFARVRPQVSIEHPLVVATAEPEFYKAQIVGGYEMEITGKKPLGWDVVPNATPKRDGVQNATNSGEAGRLGTPAQ